MVAPKLRFKEFEENWHQKSLGSIASKIGSGSTPRGGAEVYQLNGVPFIRSQNVNSNQLQLNELAFISQKIDEKMKGSRVQPNDILLNITGASIGRSCVVPDNFLTGNVNQHVCIIRLDNNEPKFLQPYLSSEKGQKIIENAQSGSGREGLNFENIRNFKIYFPTLPEQTKIANFLSAVDERIQQLSQTHELLTQYKKGVMQKIFSQELRFKDENGEEFGAWEMRLVGDIFETKRGNVLAASNVSECKSGEYKYPVYSSQTKNNGVMGYYNAFLFKNCITWTTDGANAGDTKFRANEFYCTNVCGVLINNNGYANQCVSEIINSISKSYVSYVGNPKLMNNIMSNIPILIPSSVKEQTKIANFLSAIDDKINQAKSQLTALQDYKRSLLQQMFI